MKKQYAKGFKYSVVSASYIRPTVLILEDNGKYGVNKLEAQIHLQNGTYVIDITDGFKSLAFFYHKQGLKSAMNLAHGKMVALKLK